MNSTTSKRMNFLIQRNDDRINAVIPKAMREMVKEQAKEQGMSESNYIKLALQNQLERDVNQES